MLALTRGYLILVDQMNEFLFFWYVLRNSQTTKKSPLHLDPEWIIFDERRFFWLKKKKKEEEKFSVPTQLEIYS